MKQFLSQIKPKFIISALFFLLTSAIPTCNSAYLRYEISESITNYDTTPDLTIDDPLPDISLDTPNDDESYEFFSELIIKAVNPGYTSSDKLSNVGELIELQNLANTTISLAGFSLRYTNGSGKTTTLHTFSEEDLMTGEFLLMRYAKSPDSDQSELTYSTSLAMSAGPLELVYGDEIVDQVCWTNKNDCEKSFKSTSPTTLVRSLTTGAFEHVSNYEPHFNPDNPSLFTPETEISDDSESPDDAEKLSVSQCHGLEFSEIYTYYADTSDEQFIEFYNSTSHDISLTGCQIKYKNKLYPLTGAVSANGYLAYYPSTAFTFTKNPTSNNAVSLIDADNETVDELVYPHGQKKSASYSKLYDSNGESSWSITYAITPNSANNLQEFRTCPTGKVINPLTGNCVNITSITTETECPAGKYRNPLTGRCKSISSTTSTLKECAEGYERNPETNRCRKVTLPNTGADYALVPSTQSSGTTFIALGAVILIVSLGLVYITFQFRYEIIRAVRKIRQSSNHILKDHFARKVSRNRNKKS